MFIVEYDGVTELKGHKFVMKLYEEEVLIKGQDDGGYFPVDGERYPLTDEFGGKDYFVGTSYGDPVIDFKYRDGNFLFSGIYNVRESDTQPIKGKYIVNILAKCSTFE